TSFSIAALSDNKREAGSGQRAAGSRQLEAGSRQLEAESRKPAAGSWKPNAVSWRQGLRPALLHTGHERPDLRPVHLFDRHRLQIRLREKRGQIEIRLETDVDRGRGDR